VQCTAVQFLASEPNAFRAAQCDFHLSWVEVMLASATSVHSEFALHGNFHLVTCYVLQQLIEPIVAVKHAISK
jgi:hypothetical protein